MNYSLPDEHVTIKPDASYDNVGNVSFMACGRIGISPSDGWTVGQYIVMNDYLEFDGQIIMNADPVEKKTPTPGRIPESTQIDRDILYQPDLLIEPENQMVPSIRVVMYSFIHRLIIIRIFRMSTLK